MIVLKRASLWLALAGVLFTIWIISTSQRKEPMPPPIQPPPTSPFAGTVAASGIIEAVNENVRVGPPVAGLVTEVFVVVGNRVKAGDPLFQLDDRELRAQLAAREASIPPARARVDEQTYRVRDLTLQHQRLVPVHENGYVSDDELKRAWYAVEVAKRGLVRSTAELKEAIARRDETKFLVERLTVRAPRDGTVLQVKIRTGEYAKFDPEDPLILLGNTEQLQVRADVDEVNAPLVMPGQPAVAYLKGSTERSIKLTFVRIEPYIVPKRSLTGENSERVDTRVLQIIYRFDPPPFPVYAGQQVDVFIEREALTPSAKQESKA